MLLVLRSIKLDEMQFITRSSCINRFEIINSISVVSVIHLNQEEIRIIKSTNSKVSIQYQNSRKIIYEFTLNQYNTKLFLYITLQDQHVFVRIENTGIHHHDR